MGAFPRLVPRTVVLFGRGWNTLDFAPERAVTYLAVQCRTVYRVIVHPTALMCFTAPVGFTDATLAALMPSSQAPAPGAVAPV
jgi:hypothetical protein